MASNMAYLASQREIFKVGPVTNWLKRTDLRGRRLRLFDMDSQVVGRAASAISRVLQGKDRPDFCTTQDMGDVVIVINADKLVLTGEKPENKIYFRHSGKPGNLKQFTPADWMEKYGGAPVVWSAVNGMLPKNKLRKRRMDKLLIYNDDQHDFDESFLFPLVLPNRHLKPSKLRWNMPEGFEPMNAPAYYGLWRSTEPELQAQLDSILERHAAELQGAPPLETSDDVVLRQGLRLQ